MSGNEVIIVGPGQTRDADARSLVAPDGVQCKVRTSDLGGRLSIVLADHAPWQGSPLHRHLDGDEWFYVIKGEFAYEAGSVLHRVLEGGSLVAPTRIPHRYINGPAPGTLIVGLSPGGRLEEFFEEGARLRKNPGSTPPSREDVVALYAKYNVEYLGERLTKEDFANAST
jgi:quercetin dioxygenase-like cupin family protein